MDIPFEVPEGEVLVRLLDTHGSWEIGGEHGRVLNPGDYWHMPRAYAEGRPDWEIVEKADTKAERTAAKEKD